ncbi:hypothetical protein [Tropicibacter alexandrii]|uniref:hypothetical protein n=1 Tax=Tropicibacter alexandrii TaxID=2267683 RepID=UPI000EF4C3C0|nr:hypothetical protein [Tropicibacter alexandrii]
MARIICFILALGASAAQADTDPWEVRRAQCVGFMMAGGYPSGLVEQGCRRDFALPSAFLFRCARAQTQGFETDLQRRACVAFFAQSAERAQAGYVIN